MSTDFNTTPSLTPASQPTVSVEATTPTAATAVGIFVASRGPVPEALGVDRAQLDTAGFDATVGTTLVLPAAAGAPAQVAVGVGEPTQLDLTRLRDAAASFARAAASHRNLALMVTDTFQLDPDAAAHAVVEGVLLARYRYDVLRRETKATSVDQLTLIGGADLARIGAERGRIFAAATALARDLANTPHSHLTASDLADIAVSLSAERGLEVEVFDKEALVELGCGGLLAINAGSAEPPRMIKLTYRPSHAESTGRLALVGKGIMYDSGGISLKPSDRVHAQMKNDMSGAAAVLAAMSALAELECTTTVTGYLMCTDNMPSGTATGLGDVITMRNGMTVEMIDTDAEGRVVMADALALAAEGDNDAIVDIATLTGSAVRALGTDLAAVFGNDDSVIDQVKTAAQLTDELVWHLPLHRAYRKDLDSLVADVANCAPIGKPDAILASLFLAEFVGEASWAHIDMCGQAQNDHDRSWHPEGCTGFGARLLLQLMLDFVAPARA